VQVSQQNVPTYADSPRYCLTNQSCTDDDINIGRSPFVSPNSWASRRILLSLQVGVWFMIIGGDADSCDPPKL
jgi:hypothetical protein